MTKLDDLRNVVMLACFTEDRDPAEQRSLLAVAMHVDQECSAFISWNRDFWPPTLTTHVIDTYDPSVGRHVHLTSSQRDKLDRMQERWSWCVRCRAPMGAHLGNDDPCPREWWASMAVLRDNPPTRMNALRDAGHVR